MNTSQKSIRNYSASALSLSLTAGLIRETLNPRPLSVAFFGEIREYGYVEAMIDACFRNTVILEDEAMTPEDWVALCVDTLAYKGCEWRAYDWPEEAVATLEQMVEVLDDMDYSL